MPENKLCLTFDIFKLSILERSSFETSILKLYKMQIKLFCFENISLYSFKSFAIKSAIEKIYKKCILENIMVYCKRWP